MKKILTFIFFFILLTKTNITGINAQEISSESASIHDQLEITNKKIINLEKNIKIENKVDRLINIISVFSTILLSIMGIILLIGGFVIWDSSKTKNEAKKELDSIKAIHSESNKIAEAIEKGYKEQQTQLKNSKVTAQEIKKLKELSKSKSQKTSVQNDLKKVVSNIEKRQEYSGYIDIYIPRKTSKETLKELGRMLKENIGEQKIQIIIPNGEKPEKLILPYSVNWTQKLKNDVSNLLGHSSH